MKFFTGTRGGWHKYPQNPVLGGTLGVCFDISLLKADNTFYMYFSWRTQKSVAVVTSTDGVQWSEPVICVAPQPDPLGREDDINRPAVVQKDGVYHMWYTGQYKAGQPDGTSHLFHAV